MKVKSNNINHGNNKADFNKIKGKNNAIEDINLKNIRSQRSMSIKNPINNDCKFNRNIHHNFHEISATNIRNNYPNTEININSNDYLNTSIDNKFNHEQMLLDLIDITNQYHNKDNKVNMNNIIDEYKSLLYDFKLKNEFIYKIVGLYNNSTNSDLKYNDSESLLPTWNWIRDNQNKIANSNILNKNEDNQYKNLCEDIMKQYNIKNIQQLKKFIGKLCKKVDKNENFLEGIKKILLP
jgi:disulfide oxidoreductase YuzD